MLFAVVGDKVDGSRRATEAVGSTTPRTFVRLELEAALARKVRIIPVLVEGAGHADEDQLPPSLSGSRAARPWSSARPVPRTRPVSFAFERSLAEDRATRTPRPCDARAGSAPAQAPPAPSVSAAHSPGRPPAVTLSLAGAALGIVANTQYGSADGPSTAFAPETLETWLLVAAAAVLLQAGRIREQLAYGLLLGFGLTTTAAAIGLGLPRLSLAASTLRALHAPQGAAPSC